MKVFLRFLGLLWPYRRAWAAALFLSGVAACAGALNPYLAKWAIDDSLLKKDAALFFRIVLLGGAIFLAHEGSVWLKEYLGKVVRARVLLDLNKRLFSHMQRLSWSWFKERTAGEHLYKLDYDASVVADFVTDALPQILFLAAKFLFIFILLFTLSAKLAVFAFVVAALLCLPPYLLILRFQKVLEASVGVSEGVFSRLEEIFSHALLIKVFGAEKKSIRAYVKMLVSGTRLRLQNIKLEIFSDFAAESSIKIVFALLGLYGGLKVISGEVTLGALSAAVGYMVQLFGLQAQCVVFFQNIVTARLSCRRLSEVLDEAPSVVEVPGATEMVWNRGEVVLRGVSFGYAPGACVFRGLDIRMEAGAHAALVGPSGCGKTTLLNLLARLYDPSSGEIFIDGQDIRGVRLASLKDGIGFVLQEPFLWNDTIENNIRYGGKQASPREVLAAAALSGVSVFAEKLKDGYRAVIGENAARLSEGQKQKIAIARALIKRPKILILDEAMSSMDAESEMAIMDALKNEMPDMTIIVVSHRLSTVMQAERVYYLAAPDKIVVGRPQELAAHNAGFIKLFSGQEKMDA